VKRALLLLALLALPASAQHKPWFTGVQKTGATQWTPPVGATIDSVTSGTASGSTTLTITPTSIPSGAVVVFLYSCWTGVTGVPTSANLTFTQRATTNHSSGNNYALIFTAVSGSTLSSEAISVTTPGAGERPSGSVVVLTGADTGSLTNAATNTATGSSGTVAVTAVGTASWVLGTLAGFGTSVTASAGASTTQLYNPAGSNMNFHSRNTSAGTGSITLTATFSGSADWAAAAIEIR
jgi:hypothetical protein